MGTDCPFFLECDAIELGMNLVAIFTNKRNVVRIFYRCLLEGQKLGGKLK
jgi:hypothetical protein